MGRPDHYFFLQSLHQMQVIEAEVLEAPPRLCFVSTPWLINVNRFPSANTNEVLTGSTTTIVQLVAQQGSNDFDSFSSLFHMMENQDEETFSFCRRQMRKLLSANFCIRPSHTLPMTSIALIDQDETQSYFHRCSIDNH